MKKILILFLLITSTLSAQKKLDKLLNKFNKNNVPYISVDTLATRNAILLDAREEKEYKVSHLKNAILVGFNHFNIHKTLEKLPEDKSAKIVVYCSLGIRSEIIAHQLIEKGYTNVFNLYGGIFEWKNNNYQVLDTLGNTTEKIHTFNKKWSKWLFKGEKVYE
ncbi:rhodanese-like domain-containing protein [Polaribacter sp. Z014]|uniref:rhodanese-like domain-containing protein n=1 Tax=unclassified Polaribacter TaxID=196858 RepID=UPI00193BAFAF|nr:MULTISPECIES: rhodanese-like domain-containing protein [unclassified Polaribacter]MCL7764351.1 rhodanese-like domain-containing protein [Polaribacter sp. Z014]QVY67370.1 rhodanese-like domain-containing protein [Polaribacter sp. Q13]